jgi:hypothetical protein
VRCNQRLHPDLPGPALTILFQPSGETLLGLCMGSYTTLSHGLLATGDTFKDGHALLHELIGLNVKEVCTWEAMLGNKNWLFVPLNVREEFSGLTLEGGDEFSTHKVTLQYHFSARN